VIDVGTFLPMGFAEWSAAGDEVSALAQSVLW